MRSSRETELRQNLADIATPQILVVGDLMLDRYSWGKVRRISPEAPMTSSVLSGASRRKRIFQ